MSKLLCISPVLLLAASIGCGQGEIPPEEAFAPEKLMGHVDESLPPELQAKQKVLKRILVSLEEGVDFDYLPEEHPDVQLEESMEDFLEGTINLARWDFNGPPAGDGVPVVLYFSRDTSGRNERRVTRVYTVTGSKGRWTISRK